MSMFKRRVVMTSDVRVKGYMGRVCCPYILVIVDEEAVLGRRMR